MITEKVQKLLILLENIEKTVSNIYASMAVNQNFGDEARRFWATMMGAELVHASLFKDIRKQAQKNTGLQLELRFKEEDLSIYFNDNSGNREKFIPVLLY